MVASVATSRALATFLQAETNACRSSWFKVSFAASTSAGAASAGGRSPSKFISVTTGSPASYLFRILSVTSLTPSEGSNRAAAHSAPYRSEEHTSELQSQSNLVCRLLLEKKKTHDSRPHHAV